MICRAFQASHKSILYGKTLEDDVGSTTILGGILLELEVPIDNYKFAFILGSLGDCKAYHWISQKESWDEITKGNRPSSDPRDPGGRYMRCVTNEAHIFLRLGQSNSREEPDLGKFGFVLSIYERRRHCCNGIRWSA
jgi:hypothetical protein